MPTAVVVGMTTAPSLMIASIDSHSSTWLPSMSTTLVPGTTPSSSSRAATWSERRTSSAKVYSARSPFSCTTTRPRRWSSRAQVSNQSWTQLNLAPTSGQAKLASAPS